MKLAEYLDRVVLFLKDYLEKVSAQTYVIGLSGGVDSSLCAVLAEKAVGKNKLLGVIIPIDSNPADMEDALILIKTLDIKYIVYDGTALFEEFKNSAEKAGVALDRSAQSNLKARLRMTILYAISAVNNGLVIGTDNADERYTGYFTKHGDGACDILPIAHLLKCEVVEAAKMLGISKNIVERVPTAGLYKGQTDEKEMGVTYRELDDYLSGKVISEGTKARIEHLNRISRHKIEPTPMPEPFERDK